MLWPLLLPATGTAALVPTAVRPDVAAFGRLHYSRKISPTVTMVSDVEDDVDDGPVEGEVDSAVGAVTPDRLAMTWQTELEKIVSPRTTDEERQMLLRDLLSRGPEISEEVNAAIESGDLAALTGDSELASDLDNVRRQVLDDLLPDATTLLSDPTRLAEEFAAAAPGIAQDTSAAAPGVASAFASLLADPARAAALAQQEVGNVFSRTPEGLAMPPYRVLSKGEGYEVREYDPVSVVTIDVAPSSAGGAIGGDSVNLSGSALVAYNALLAYFLGGNSDGAALELTSPARLDEPSGPPGLGGISTLSFMLPSGLTVSSAPAPTSQSVRLEQRSMETVAVAAFGGIATPGEVRRSLSRLREALGVAAVEEGDQGFYSLLQYNPPYTLPWLRTNEVAVPIKLAVEEEATEAGSTPQETQQDPVVEVPTESEDESGDEFYGAPSD